MNTTPARICLAALAAAILAACTVTADPPAPAAAEDNDSADSWLQGTVDERLDTVADQLRGFGATMVEVDHRYIELYFAGQDRNWEYAAHQVGEIGEALEYGLQRRPERSQNAAMLEPAMDAVQAAIEGRDPVGFDAAFERLTASCNACHLAEEVAFIHVGPPGHRRSSVRPAAGTGD